MALEVTEAQEIRQEIEGLFGKVKVKLDKQADEVKQYGQTSDETKAGLTKLSDQIDVHKTEVQELVDTIRVKYEDLEKKMQRARFGALMGDKGSIKTLGRIVLDSDEYKQWKADKGYGKLRMSFDRDIALLGAKDVARFLEMQKKAVELTSTELGALVQEFRWDQIIQFPLRPRRLVDIINTINTGQTGNIEYPEENVTFVLYAEMETQSSSGQKDVVLKKTAEGFYPGQTVVLSPGEAQEETIVLDTVAHSTRTLTSLTNLVNTHVVDRGVQSDTFVFTPEANIKPNSRIEFVLREAAIRTLANWLPFSRQMLMDAPTLRNIVDNRLMEFVDLAKERQILYGADTDREIQGILTHTGISSYLWSDGTVGDTKLDAIRRAITFVSLSFFLADAIVIHNNDLEDIELTKGQDGHYIFTQAQVGPGVSVVWRANVIESPVINVGTALAGNFRQGTALWQRSEAELRIAEQHEDFFVRNLVVILIEERLAQSILRPSAFVEITFDNEPPTP